MPLKTLILSLLLMANCPLGLAETAIFAGGCFWCTQADLSKLNGVNKTIAGFDGGHINKPSYKLVSDGKTKYVESVWVKFNPEDISYQELVHAYLRTIDPTQPDGQFCDNGPQYRSVIFYLNEKQKNIALTEINKLRTKFKTIATEVLPSTTFYPAEDYHQHYAKKNPARYRYFRWLCGRDKQLKETWKY